MADYHVSLRAYCKILSHAAKYPHCSVNGVLLAEDTKQKDSSKRLNFVDSIPLFHVCIGLTPMSELALTLVSKTLKWCFFPPALSHSFHLFVWLLLDVIIEKICLYLNLILIKVPIKWKKNIAIFLNNSDDFFLSCFLWRFFSVSP